VAVAPDGQTIYVADSGNNRIQTFDPAGTFLSTWGSKGAGEGQLSFPMGVAVTPDGKTVYVADVDNHRIQIFDAGRAFQGQWGRYGSSDGSSSTRSAWR
jgi:DNA-binding beta-propeller fold protein YncE